MSADRPDPPAVRILVALCVAAFLVGFAASLLLLGQPSAGKVAFWIALFIAVTALAILQRKKLS